MGCLASGRAGIGAVSTSGRPATATPCVLGRRHIGLPTRLARARGTSTLCRAEPLAFDLSKYANKAVLDQAARRYALGLEAGFDEDELIALELGAPSMAAVPEATRKYSDKIKEKLKKRADEMKKEEEEAKAKISGNLNRGKLAYEYGEYPASVKLLEQAVNDVGAETPLGGEAQLWLALAYQAVGREQDCIDLYKDLEANHPVRKVKKKAGELRFIMEAPKLPLGEDEVVKIPIIQSDTWRQKERASYSPKYNKAPMGSANKEKSSYWDRDLEAPSLMDIIPDKWYYRVLWAAVLVLLIVYANMNAA